MQIITRNWDKIDPLNINSYIRQRGYEALQKAVREMSPDDVVKEVKSSGLRGRGGAGFPTGEKWECATQTKSAEKYFVCNLENDKVSLFFCGYIFKWLQLYLLLWQKKLLRK